MPRSGALRGSRRRGFELVGGDGGALDRTLNCAIVDPLGQLVRWAEAIKPIDGGSRVQFGAPWGLVRSTPQIRCQPSHHFFHRHPRPSRIAFHLIPPDLAQREVLGLRAGKIEPADPGGRVHGKGLGEGNDGPFVDIERCPREPFFGVGGAGKILVAGEMPWYCSA